jgi:hypothetical protein
MILQSVQSLVPEAGPLTKKRGEETFARKIGMVPSKVAANLPTLEQGSNEFIWLFCHFCGQPVPPVRQAKPGFSIELKSVQHVKEVSNM